MNHPLLRNFLLGHAHANSAPTGFDLDDIDLNSEHITSLLTPDEIETEMAEVSSINDHPEDFWYSLGQLADAGYTMTVPDDDGTPGARPLKCFTYLDETL